MNLQVGNLVGFEVGTGVGLPVVGGGVSSLVGGAKLIIHGSKWIK